MDTVKKSSSLSNHSSGKLLMILEFLADQTEPIRLLDMSKQLGINSSTLLRFLSALIEYGSVRQDEDTLKYSLTYKICALGNKVSSNIDFAYQARPYMRQLSQLFPAMISLGLEQNQQVVYVATIQEHREMLQVMHRIGSVAPMYCTGIGKLLLLNYSAADIDEYCRTHTMTRFTENTITTKDVLLQELMDIRCQGYARDREECEIGASCIAFPVYDASGSIAAGISISGPTSRMNDVFSSEARIAEGMQIVRKLSFELGYMG